MNQYEEYQENGDVHVIDDYPLRRSSNIQNIEVYGASMSVVLTVLKRLLSFIECLNYRYKVCDNQSYMPYIDPCLYVGLPAESFDFELEYGTIPKMKTLNKHQRYAYGNMRCIMIDAIKSAINRFPHNAPEEDEEDKDAILGLVLPFPATIRKWCKTTINLYEIQKDDGQTVISIDFARLSGDRWTSFWIYRHMAKQFETELLWETRRHYMAMFEGHLTATGPTANYIFDEYVARDICTFNVPTVYCNF